MKAELLVDSQCILAEGIQWRADQERLWWTDIHGRSLWSCTADGGEVRRIETPERLGSFAFDPDGHLLAAFESGLFKWDLGRDRLERLTDFEATHLTSRLNDGRCDRQGRFVTGGVDEDGLKPTSSVIRYTGTTPETLVTDMGCSNSICFSPDGATFYVTDTPTGVIRRMAYPGTGAPGAAEVFFDEEDCPGMPDGSCVDADGSLWNARFNGFAVVEIRADGTRGRTVELPVPQVTCACFGGPNLDRLYITTARENMTDAEIADYPHSGGIFVVDPGGHGLPEDRYAKRLFPA